MKWTQEQIDQLLQLHAEKKTKQAIADIMGISRNGVIGKLFRIKGKQQPKRGKICKTIPQYTVGYVGLDKLEAHQCRWPIDKEFCGCERLKGAAWPYCEEHLMRARRKC